jgi:hypothetical protein
MSIVTENTNIKTKESEVTVVQKSEENTIIKTDFHQINSQKTDVEIDLESNEFAVMNGVIVEKQPEAETKTENIEPEEIITVRPVWQQAWIKIVVVGGGIFVVIMVLWGMAFNAMNALNTNPQKNQQTAQQSDKKVQTLFAEGGKDKALAALTSQKGELKKISDQQTPATLEKPQATPGTQATLTQVPSLGRVIASSPPIVPKRTLSEVRPDNYSRPFVNKRIANYSLPIQRNPVFIRSRPISKEVPTQVRSNYLPKLSQSGVLPLKKNIEPDAMQQWLLASSIGNYTSPNKLSVKEVSSVSVNELKSSEVPQVVPVPKVDTKRVLTGTRAYGKLENPVTWGRGLNQSQNVLIRLSSPMKANDGSIVVPEKSFVVAKLLNTGESDIVQMTAISIIVNGIEKTVPENCILVFNKNGSPLQPKIRTRSSFGSDLTASFLSGTSKAAEVINQPRNQSTLTSINGFSSYSSDSRRDVSAGFVQGSTQQLVQRMQSQNQQNTLSLQSGSKTFFVKSGTDVELIVNQSFDL